MFILLKDGDVFLNGKFEKTNVLVKYGRIIKIGPFDYKDLSHYDIEIEIIDCTNYYICPGFIDSQLQLAGGSGEQGFLSQPPRILIEECIMGGITTAIGTIGVDTTTKTMSSLFGSVRAFREAGMSSYAYTGGYEIPPQTITGSVRSDIIFIDEIIGAGEISIADRRAPEPSADALSRVVIDSYVAGFMTHKAGVTRIHVGEGRRKLKTIRDMCEVHEIQFESLYITHLERSKELVREGIEIAKKGSYVDFDIHENDLELWYKYYLEIGGPPEQLSFSSDAGVSSPTELWIEIKKCVLQHKIPFEKLLPHVTTVPAQALKLPFKGTILAGNDADLIVVDKINLDIHYVMASGKFFFRAGKFQYSDQPYTGRRKVDWHGIRK